MFGLLQRSRTVLAFSIPARDKEHMLALLRENKRPGRLRFIDGCQDYASLSVRGENVIVRKERGKPNGCDHISGIEGFSSYAKH